MSLLESTARFARDSALLFASHRPWRERVRVWNSFLKLSVEPGRNAQCAHLAGFKVLYFDKPTLLFLYREIFVRGIYEFHSSNTEPVIFDCGANIGMATLFFKSHLPASQVHSFEPDPMSFQVLERNVADN